MQTAIECFRMSFWRLAVSLVTVGTAVAVPLAAGMVAASGARPGLELLAVAFAAGIAGGEVAGLLGAWALVTSFRIYVSPVGLRAFDFWGRYREAVWAEIVSVRPVNFLGLKY